MYSIHVWYKENIHVSKLNIDFQRIICCKLISAGTCIYVKLLQFPLKFDKIGYYNVFLNGLSLFYTYFAFNDKLPSDVVRDDSYMI